MNALEQLKSKQTVLTQRGKAGEVAAPVAEEAPAEKTEEAAA